MRSETEAAINAVSTAIQLADIREGADKINSKGGIDLVTGTDLLCEDSIRDSLALAFPAYPVIGEERGGSPVKGKPYWLVDPICGTRPYASNIPLYCTNIALVEDMEVTAAVIGLGRFGEIIFAEKGEGAWMRTRAGDERLSVNDRSNTLWVDGRGAHAGNMVRNTMLRDSWYVWQFSSSIAYAYLAAGRISGVVHFAPQMSPVHTAAGCLAAREAGAIVTDINGGPWDLDTRNYLLTATSGLHQELQGLIEASR